MRSIFGLGGAGHFCLAIGAVVLFGGGASGVAAQNTLVVEGQPRYEPTGYPDRIVLTFSGSPDRSLAVTWRTDTTSVAAVAEIAVAGPGSWLHTAAETVTGRTTTFEAENGVANHHSVVFSDLRPGTLYAYRVGGTDTWSEWFQFRTAQTGFAPFAFLYFGDAQNAVKSHFSRTIRQAALDLPEARTMVFAGDLVNLRDGNHDDEWGEWFDAGGWLHGMIPSIVAAGNHEYVTYSEPTGSVQRLSPHWPVQFTLPEDGPAGLREAVYSVDFQGVRFIQLNSAAALYDDTGETAQQQAAWLEQRLSDNPNRWTVVTFHHPVVSVARGRDNPQIQEAWQPLLERYGVDLVLQGHDHAYGRGANLGNGTAAWTEGTGTMYVVSVSGPKMYLASDEAKTVFDRVAEDTQLYQIVRVEWDRLVYEARTATGELYDAFTLHKAEDGAKRLEDLRPASSERFCEHGDSTLLARGRCSNGTEGGRTTRRGGG